MELEQIITLINAVSDSELSEFSFEEGNLKLTLSKKKKFMVSPAALEADPSSAAVSVVPVKKENHAEKGHDETAGNVVVSPLVGVFYSAPAENADPFVRIGDSVKKGQTLAIVEAMKLMNEIESEYDGVVAEIYPKNGQSVEFGQPLFRIQ